MNKRTFLIDSSSFITPFNTYYSLEYVPGFWQALIRENDKGRVFTIDAVKQEVLKREDELKKWFSGLSERFVLDTDGEVFTVYSSIIQWVNQHDVFAKHYKESFSNGADGLLVAYAKVHGNVVVTEESAKDDPKMKRVKIPNVCRQFGVSCINIVEMLKELDVRFILDGPQRHDLFTIAGMSD